MVDFQLKPLEIVDGRIPCPVCQTVADLTHEAVIIVGVGVMSQEEKPIWECPTCHHRFADLRK